MLRQRCLVSAAQVGFEALFFAGFFGLAYLALSFRRYGSR